MKELKKYNRHLRLALLKRRARKQREADAAALRTIANIPHCFGGGKHVLGYIGGGPQCLKCGIRA